MPLGPTVVAFVMGCADCCVHRCVSGVVMALGLNQSFEASLLFFVVSFV